MEAIGMVESNSIGRGIDATDAMLKRAAVEVIYSRSVCPGKYIVLVTGLIADVESSIEAGVEQVGSTFVDELILPNVHSSIIPALRQATPVLKLEALGILESFTAASIIVASDIAAKAATVDMIEIRMAIALGGKAFCTFTGDEASVQESVASGAEYLRSKGLLVSEVVIPGPHRDILPFLL